MTAVQQPAVVQPVQPLTPAKIAVNDPSTIVTAVMAIVATVLNAWPGTLHGLPANAPVTTALIAGALAVATIFSKHMLSSAAVTAAAGAPATQAGLAAHQAAQTQAMTNLQAALEAALEAMGSTPPPQTAYPAAGVPIVAAP